MQPELVRGPEKRLSTLRSLAAALAGVILQVVALLVLRPLQRRSVLDPQPLPHSPFPWVEAYLRALQWVQTWPQSLVLFLFFLVLAIRKREKDRGWTFAFLAGVMVPGMLFQFFSRL